LISRSNTKDAEARDKADILEAQSTWRSAGINNLSWSSLSIRQPDPS